MDIFKPECELNNNVTIMVELAVGGGLAALFFWIQRKSTKKQTDIWKENRENILYSISAHANLIVRQIDRYNEIELLDEAVDNSIKGLSSTLNNGKEFLEPGTIQDVRNYLLVVRSFAINLGDDKTNRDMIKQESISFLEKLDYKIDS